jgi:hypothetical protein
MINGLDERQSCAVGQRRNLGYRHGDGSWRLGRASTVADRSLSNGILGKSIGHSRSEAETAEGK